MSITDTHIVLQIIKGIPKAPGDPNSAEQEMESLDLLDSTGIGLLVEGWSPQFASLKNGGLWADSSTIDGRALMSDNVGNAVETMQLTCSSPLVSNRITILKKLGRLIQAAREFHGDTWQIEPVYLKWRAACGAGDQYALLYNIEVAMEGDVYDPESAWDLTLTLEREPYWRGLWPGANPIEWHFQAQGKTRGITTPNEGYTYADMRLAANTDHFAYKATVVNRCEWNAANTALISENFIDLPAIPGDAPALVYANIQSSTSVTRSGLTKLWMGLSNLPRSILEITQFTPTELTQSRPAFNILNAGDSSAGVRTVTADTCGVFSNLSEATRYIATYTIAAGPASTFTANIVTWAVGTNVAKRVNLWRGTWAVFLRCKATNGSDGDVRVRLASRIQNHGVVYTDEQQIPVLTPAASCEKEWGLVALGALQIPFDRKAFSAITGRGLSGDSDPHFELEARNTAAATRNLEFLDLIFMPIDSGLSAFIRTTDADAPTDFQPTQVVFDNTGYSGHGEAKEVCVAGLAGVSTGSQTPQELRGNVPQLQPGENNRLYFLSESRSLTVSHSIPAETFTVRLNIVPRWVGVRDS